MDATTTRRTPFPDLPVGALFRYVASERDMIKTGARSATCATTLRAETVFQPHRLIVNRIVYHPDPS